MASLQCDMQGESVRSQRGIKMTIRRCPLVSVLDGTTSHLDGVEQSCEKNVIKSQSKNTWFLAFHTWCLKIHVKYMGTLSGAYPQVPKSCRGQDSPTSTMVAVFPSPYVLQIKSPGETLRGREGQGGS